MSRHLHVRLTDVGRKELEKTVRSGKNKVRVITRARILLMADRKGLGNWPVMMAGIVVSTLSVLIAFVIGQK